VVTESVREAYSSASERYIDLVDGSWQVDGEDAAFIRRHLAGVRGSVLDLGCGPGHWTAHLHSLGVQVSGVDLVPAFVEHARAHHPGPEFRLGSMLELDAPDRSVAGILTWYSTIHLPPPAFDGALVELRRLLVPGGVLVVGFFDSDDTVAAFDHAVTTAYRWPLDVVVEHLAAAGLDVVDRLRREVPERPDRKYAAVAARAV
jgi:SAM-dependent methyltransferase